jgi:hypothetical protein
MSAETNDAVKSDSHFLMLRVGLAEGGHPVLLAPGAQKDAEGVCLNGSSFGGGGRTGKFWERRFKFSYLSKLKGEEEEARCRTRKELKEAGMPKEILCVELYTGGNSVCSPC